MDNLFENFKAVVKDTVPRRVSGKTPQDFVLSCVLKTPGNGFEEFKVDVSSIFDEVELERQQKVIRKDS